MPVNIKGKEYVTVAERMELLRQSSKPFEMVESKAIQLGDRVAWQVSIMIDSRLFIGSAEAHLNAKPGSADATDPFACAETSAIGRALGLAGFGSLDSIASADEIVRNQEPASDGKLAEVKAHFLKMYKPEKWEAFKVGVLGLPVADEGLSDSELAKINGKLMEIGKQKLNAAIRSI